MCEDGQKIIEKYYLNFYFKFLTSSFLLPDAWGTGFPLWSFELVVVNLKK